MALLDSSKAIQVVVEGTNQHTLTSWLVALVWLAAGGVPAAAAAAAVVGASAAGSTGAGIAGIAAGRVEWVVVASVAAVAAAAAVVLPTSVEVDVLLQTGRGSSSRPSDDFLLRAVPPSL